MKRSPIVICIVLFALVSGASGQSAAFVDTIIDKGSITLGQGAYLVLVASGAIPDTADQKQAFARLDESGLAPRGSVAESPLLLGDYAYLTMKTLGLRGSFLYAILPGPRYAFRHLVYRHVIQGRADPGMPVSGTMALDVIRRALELAGAAK